MNYFLHYSGDIPHYVQHCIQNIKNIDRDSEIYFLTDNNYINSNVVTINIQDISYTFIEEFTDLDYFKKNNNPLWVTSVQRIFYLYNAAKLLKVDKFIHFDSDVLIYKPYRELKYLFKENKVNITPGNEKSIIFGYSYISGLENFELVCQNLIDIFSNAKYYEDKFNGGNTLNEMVALSICFIENSYLFNLLPTVPNKDEKIIFDANSYGQYISGTDNKILNSRYINPSHYSGRSMLEKGFRPKLKLGRPYIKLDNSLKEIANLHIHKKNLKKYMAK